MWKFIDFLLYQVIGLLRTATYCWWAHTQSYTQYNIQIVFIFMYTWYAFCCKSFNIAFWNEFETWGWDWLPLCGSMARDWKGCIGSHKSWHPTYSRTVSQTHSNRANISTMLCWAPSLRRSNTHFTCVNTHNPAEWAIYCTHSSLAAQIYSLTLVHTVPTHTWISTINTRLNKCKRFL